MSEQQLKHIFLTNKKSFLEIFNKETEEKGFGCLFIDFLKTSVNVYFLPEKDIPYNFLKNLKKNKKNFCIISTERIIYIQL